ncbi:MAG TPA: hypothetical protein V6D25_20680, partial [Leptolyngbyaceae cyanobacterium]
QLSAVERRGFFLHPTSPLKAVPLDGLTRCPEAVARCPPAKSRKPSSLLLLFCLCAYVVN